MSIVQTFSNPPRGYEQRHPIDIELEAGDGCGLTFTKARVKYIGPENIDRFDVLVVPINNSVKVVPMFLVIAASKQVREIVDVVDTTGNWWA